MTTVAATAVALTAALPAPSKPTGYTWAEQSNTAAGNKIANTGRTMMGVRNSNAAARTVSFYADIFAVEVVILTKSVPGSGTANGLDTWGPFPRGVFNDHSTTSAANNGQLVFSSTGSDADLKLCPFELSDGLLFG